MKAAGNIAIIMSDLLALTLLKPPGECGADIVCGSAQRFGVPLGFGGPHAAFFATRTAYQRMLPGRLVGVSKDSAGRIGYRLALQTREQHIRREKATSNICTAQVLLAVIAGFYSVWHGPEGLKHIALHAHQMACLFARSMQKAGYKIRHADFFDTVVIEAPEKAEELVLQAAGQGINLRKLDNGFSVSFDETTQPTTVEKLLSLYNVTPVSTAFSIADKFCRKSAFMQQKIFSRYHTETKMMRYMRALADRDLALDRCMIPLGSCTMKLNAAAEMIPVSWPAFADIHPFAPADQTQGYLTMIARLEKQLQECTGYAAISLQPNSGAQGEFAGLLAIRRYHQSNGQAHRNICLIPESAHGTNPASAHMAGMKVVVVKCDACGNIDLSDLKAKLEKYGPEVAASMLTYPSTHGVFEEGITQICQLVHQAGGQVYVDGANFNALIGHSAPPEFGADVSHLNLHKTFCIPHGGGGPGIGPIGVAAHLKPFLPESPLNGSNAVSAAPFGSAGILPITYAYIKMMGRSGLIDATTIAILSANYIATRLHPYFPVLYSGRLGRVAHECIIDIRPLTEKSGISNEDIAKRLIDFGFHAPTMSFPVPGTLMIEPTESESLAEINRFCDAMIWIAGEIEKVISGVWPQQDNPLVCAPHTVQEMLSEEWSRAYSRTEAIPQQAMLQPNKYWPPVNRIDNAFGDRHLICACPPLELWDSAAE